MNLWINRWKYDFQNVLKLIIWTHKLGYDINDIKKMVAKTNLREKSNTSLERLIFHVKKKRYDVIGAFHVIYSSELHWNEIMMKE